MAADSLAQKPIGVLIVDDHGAVLVGLRHILADEPRMEVVGEAENGLDAIQLARTCAPDVALMDITLPGMNGIDATRELLVACPHCGVIGLSFHTERALIVDMLSAGARGYLLKDDPVHEIAAAIVAVHEGGTYISPRVAGPVMGLTDEEGRPSSPCTLTRREREILQMTVEGLSAKEAAAQLGISTATVHTHLKRLRRKLGLHTQAELIRYAIRLGIIPE